MDNFAYLIKNGPEKDQEVWLIDREQFVIGRGTTAHLLIDSARISREHAIIHSEGRGYAIRDLDSRNGTFVNGARIGNTFSIIGEGDQIVLGGEIALTFHDPKATLIGKSIGILNGVWIDEASREVWVDSVKLEPPLSAQQFALLRLLYSAFDRVFSRPEMIAAVWPGENPLGISEEAVDSVIKRLRSRLRENPEKRDYLQVLRGQGVKLLPYKS